MGGKNEKSRDSRFCLSARHTAALMSLLALSFINCHSYKGYSSQNNISAWFSFAIKKIENKLEETENGSSHVS